MSNRFILPLVFFSLVWTPLAHAVPKLVAEAEHAFLERTSLGAADAKCGYFTELEREALRSGQLQARGALLRDGMTAKDVDRAAEEVSRYANLQPCGQADFMRAVGYLKDAFGAFIGTMVMDFPGEEKIWNASRSRWDTWRVVQNGASKDYTFQFGLLAPELDDPDAFPANFARPLENPLVEKPFRLTLDLIMTEDQRQPAAARILVRNPEKASEPWLGAIFSGERGPPPRSVTQAYWPTARELVKDEEKQERRARFVFSPEATAAIEKLDPRERIEIAVMPDPRSGSQDPAYIEIEVADFAAARSFSRLPPL